MDNAAKYLDIAEQLRRDILSGKYEGAERFPSEVALSRRFKASRPTIERALRELKRGGLLESRVGSGSFLTFAAKNAAGAIGIIAPDYKKIDFFTDLCDSIADASRAAGYNVYLGDVSAPDAANRGVWAVSLASAYVQRKIAGVILEPVDLVPGSTAATRAVLDILRAKNIPVVIIDRDYLPFPERSAYDLVGIDNFSAGYRLAQHLIGLGAKRLAFITQKDYASTILARIKGVAAASMDAGLGWSASRVIETAPSDREYFRRLMKGPKAPDALVCRNDALAAEALQTFTAIRVKVPRRVRLAGFDDAKIARLLNPPLTTIRQPVAELATTAVATLLERMRKPDLPARTILLDAKLVVR